MIKFITWVISCSIRYWIMITKYSHFEHKIEYNLSLADEMLIQYDKQLHYMKLGLKIVIFAIVAILVQIFGIILL